MKSEPIAQLSYQELPSGRRLLVGHVRFEITPGALVAITRNDDGELYALHAVTPNTRNPRCPSTLGSFLPPADVDQIERLHAAALAAEQAPRRRANKNRPRRADG